MHIFRYKEASGAQLALTLFLGDFLWVLDKATIVLVVYIDATRRCLTQPIWPCSQRRSAAPPPFYRGKCWGAHGGLPHHLLEVAQQEQPSVVPKPCRVFKETMLLSGMHQGVRGKTSL